MARFVEPSVEQIRLFQEWLNGRPPAVRAVAERFEPWSLYRMTTTGHRVTISGFDEARDGRVTVTVNVTGEFNRVAFDRAVFGVGPDDLKPCDLPGPDEQLGAALTEPSEIDDYINAVRPAILAAKRLN